MDSDLHANSDAAPRGVQGGKARANKLSRSRRSEIARTAAKERWSEEVRTATHGDESHPLFIGDIALPCYVLDDGTRVFSQRGMFEALALKSGGNAMRRFIDTTKGSLSSEIVGALEHPIKFRPPRGGPSAFGYPVTLLIDVCNAVLMAQDAGTLPESYKPFAARAEIFVRAVAKVGIVALVDEVTGYQDVRQKEALQAILDAYLRRELAAWAKRFPDEFYREMFRLRGWDWRGAGYSGHAAARYTNDLVYARLAPALLRELEQRNPRIDNRRQAKHHQWLTEDVGHPALAQHLHAVVAFMRASDSWDEFIRMINKGLPVKDDQLELGLQDH